ncbi:MAG: TetR/AcrR family transcriptional regulator [Pseudomonadota bacterium]
MSPLPDQAPKPYHHGDLRSHLVEVVRELVERDGPDGFSVAEAARRAGVSSAAPYKHFRDRAELLSAVALDAMGRLRAQMEARSQEFPKGSIAAVAALGKAYIDFAHGEPGMFRLTFGLTEGQDENDALMEMGQSTFAIVKRSVSDCLGRPATDPQVERSAYLLWTIVHGHSFLGIDCKNAREVASLDDWELLMAAGYAFLGADVDTGTDEDAGAGGG